MSDYEKEGSHNCCTEPYHGMQDKWRFDVGGGNGETCYVYTECQNCGTKKRDVFNFSHTESKAE